jgi:Zn-dependent M16 (insulinase) family peptidase
VKTAIRYYVDAHAITIIGKPSSSLADTLEKDEKARIAATVARLGPEGLAKLAKDVEDAQVENDKPVPSEMISKFKVPDVNLIDWISVDSARSNGVAKSGSSATIASKIRDHVNADGAELPLFIQFDRESSIIHSNRSCSTILN